MASKRSRKGSATDPIAAEQAAFAAEQMAGEGEAPTKASEPSDNPKAAGEIDLGRFPVTPAGWRYLTARPENGLRGPFICHVRKESLSRLAQAIGRQLTLPEISRLVYETSPLICGDVSHYDDVDHPTEEELRDATFVGVVALVVAGETDDSDEESEVDFVPIEGLPDELAKLIARHQDGSPKRWGPVALTPKVDPTTGERIGWDELPLCGERFFVLPDGRTVINRRTHLGGYIATMRAEGKRGFVYAPEDAHVAARIRQESSQRRRLEEMELAERRRKQYGISRGERPTAGRKVGTHGRTSQKPFRF